MAAAVSIRCPKTSDAQVVKFLNVLEEEFDAQRIIISLLGASKVINFLEEQSAPVVGELLATNGLAILSASVVLHGLSLEFRRRISQADGKLEASAIYDEIVFTANNEEQFSNNHLLELHKCIKDIFLSSSQVGTALFGEESPYADVIRSHQQIITSLEESIASIGRKLAEERFSIEKELEEKKKALAREFDQKIQSLNEENSKLRSEYEKKTEAVALREKALDDRDNTHARRALRKDLKDRLKDHSSGFKLTKDTIGLRRPIHTITIIGLFVLGALVIYYATKAAIDTNTGERLIFLIIKSLGVTVAFLGLLTWYLRWMNRWFETHATAEFQLKQLELDIDRASWVVETALEWKQEQGSAIPEHLMESISRNLFSKSEKDENADMNPVDHLASVLLGSASGLKLNIGGNEIELDRRALKEAKKG